MNSIFDIANYFLTRVEEVSPKKLQKLCYYAEAWSNALYGRSIVIDTQFEAWRNGPVSPELYHEVKVFKWNDIQSDFLSERSKELSDRNDIELLESVISTYGHLSGNELEAITHTEDPWLNQRKGYNSSDSSKNAISTEDMAEYYGNLYNGD